MRLAALLLCCIPGVALAQAGPPPLPQRDVDVTYRTQQSGQVIEQRSRFGTGLQRMRLDMPSPGLYTITDYRGRMMSIVSDTDHAVLDMALPPTVNPAVPPPATRVGTDQVAGLPCTEWQQQDSQGQPATTCFTTDGVMLRARRGSTVLAQATRVSYGPQDPALFAVPAAYAHVTRQTPR